MFAPTEFVEYTLPAHWACVLINGDESGLSDGDIAEIDGWFVEHPELGLCVNVGDEFFSRHNDANNLGGDVAVFKFELFDL